MKKLIITAFSVFTIGVNAQDYLGFLNSNYSGITGAQLNPASIADNRMVVDITLFGLNFNAGNNYLGIRREAFAHKGTYFSLLKKNNDFAFTEFDDPDFQKKYVMHLNNGKDKSL